MARSNGHRLGSVQDGIGGRRHRERLERSGIVRNMGGDHAAQPEHGVGRGVGVRHIDAALGGACGAAVVDMDAAVGNRERGLERHRFVVAIDRHAVVPGTLWQLGDLGQHGFPGPLDDVVAELSQRIDTELVHHLDQPAAADVVAAGQRIDIALGVDRLARVGANNRHQGLIHLAVVEELQHRDVEALHEHVGGIGAEADAADVHEMAGAGEQGHQLAVAETGRSDDEVVEVTGAHPRIVGDVSIARLHRVDREVTQEMLHRLGHGIHMAGRAGDGLGQHAALEIEDAGREVARLAHDRAEGGAHQRLRLLLDHGDQAVPHDLQVDQPDAVGLAHAPLLTRPCDP